MLFWTILKKISISSQNIINLHSSRVKAFKDETFLIISNVFIIIIVKNRETGNGYKKIYFPQDKKQNRTRLGQGHFFFLFHYHFQYKINLFRRKNWGCIWPKKEKKNNKQKLERFVYIFSTNDKGRKGQQKKFILKIFVTYRLATIYIGGYRTKIDETIIYLYVCTGWSPWRRFNWIIFGYHCVNHCSIQLFGYLLKLWQIEACQREVCIVV